MSGFHDCKPLDSIVIHGLVRIERTSNIYDLQQMEIFTSFFCYHQILNHQILADLWSNASHKFRL